ncbi:MAG TPA: hypothetical protein VGH87_01930, partial [Polyangiaceae bacterium]
MRPIVPLLVVAVVALSQAARAEEEKTKEGEKKETEAKEEARERGAVNLEIVIGAGQVEAINPVANGLTGQIGYERRLTDVVATGIVLSGRWDLSENFNLGLRLPIAVGTLRPADDVDRTIVNLGNVEVEAEFEKELGEHAEFFVGAHVALPTSLGNELPSEA